MVECFSRSEQVGVGSTKQIVPSFIVLSIGTAQHESKRALLRCFLRLEQDSTKATVPSSIVGYFVRSEQDGVGNTKQFASSSIVLSIGTGQHESKHAFLHCFLRLEQDSTRATVPSSIVGYFVRLEQDNTRVT